MSVAFGILWGTTATAPSGVMGTTTSIDEWKLKSPRMTDEAKSSVAGFGSITAFDARDG